MRTFHPLVRLVFSILLVLFPQAAQSQPSAPLLEIGRGSIGAIYWYPGDEQILVSTVTGAWIYTRLLTDVAHVPEAGLAALSPDGRWIAGVDPEGGVAIWDGRTFEHHITLTATHFRQVTDLAWSRDGRYLAAAGIHSVSGFFVWDSTQAWQLVNAAEGIAGRLAWSPTGDYFAVAEADGRGAIWSIGTPAVAVTFATAPSPVIRWQDDSSLLTIAPGENYQVTRWQATTGDPIERYTAPSSGRVFSGDGRYVAVDTWGTVTVQSLTEPQPPLEVLLTPRTADLQPWVAQLAWSADSRLLAVGGASSPTAASGELMIVDVAAGVVRSRDASELSGVTGLWWSHSDRYLAVRDQGQRLSIYDSLTGTRAVSSSAHSLIGEAFAWSPSGDQVAIADNRGAVTVWNLPEAVMAYTLTGDGNPISEIRWQPTGERLALISQFDAWGYDRQVEIWDVRPSSPHHVTADFLLTPDDRVEHITFAADGVHAAIISALQLSLWDLRSEPPQRLLHESMYYDPVAIALSPSGDQLAYQQEMVGGMLEQTETQDYPLSVYYVPFRSAVGTWSTDRDYVTLIWNTSSDTRTAMIEPTLVRSAIGSPSALERIGDTSTLRLEGSLSPIVQGYVSPSGHFAGAINREGTGLIWNGQTGELIAWIANCAVMSWSPDERLTAVQRTDGSIWLLGDDGAIVRRLAPPLVIGERAGSLAWSPDSRYLAHIRDGAVVLWDVQG